MTDTSTLATSSIDSQDTVRDKDAEREVLLAEYKALKDEQSKRIDRREQLVHGTLAVAVTAATLIAANRLPEVALLLFPMVCVILGWTHLTTDHLISAAGQYLRDDLSVRLTALTGAPVLGWETAHRADPRRRQRKRFQLTVDLVLFPGLAVVSLGAYLMTARPPVLGWLAALVPAVFAAVLAGQQILYATGTRRLRIGGRR